MGLAHRFGYVKHPLISPVFMRVFALLVVMVETYHLYCAGDIRTGGTFEYRIASRFSLCLRFIFSAPVTASVLDAKEHKESSPKHPKKERYNHAKKAKGRTVSKTDNIA